MPSGHLAEALPDKSLRFGWMLLRAAYLRAGIRPKKITKTVKEIPSTMRTTVIMVPILLVHIYRGRAI
jgi:hypothetical protein